MADVKAEYLKAVDKNTKEVHNVRFIPPEPEGSDLGGITEEERQKIAKNETLEVEVIQTGSDISATRTFEEMLNAYSAERNVAVRFTSSNYIGKEFVMHNVGHTAEKIEFHSVMEINGKLAFLELKCNNQNEWTLSSKQYIQTDSYYDAVADGAGAHNSLYRGKFLGNQITEEQLDRIEDGTFRGLFIGDYWTIDGVNYVIADFDYMYEIGDTKLSKHHALVVTEVSIYEERMNSIDTTANGYIGSSLYQSGLDTALTFFKNAFGESNVLIYRNLLVNATSGDNPTNWAWVNRQCDIMSESMICGQGIWRKNDYQVGCQKNQLSLFRLRHDFINKSGTWYWLRDVYSSSNFSIVGGHNDVNYNGASNFMGVRPFALIGRR